MDALRNRPRRHAIGLCMMLFGVTGAAPLAAHAGQIGAGSSFTLSGSAILTTGAPMQTAGTLQLNATLSRSGSSVAQAGAGYALTASLAAVPLVCTSDTIFEDGFEL